ncbi:MAG TPA: hypothetical protein VMU33_13635 [Burkholderiaceae bacterium]|nr:hypothetical protein [Burkholderiaceae bacterium]
MAPSESGAPRVLFAFIAGVIGVAAGFEPALHVAQALGLAPGFALASGGPLSAVSLGTLPVPRWLVLAAWGGAWALVLARLTRSDLSRTWRAGKGLAFGATAPSIGAWLLGAWRSDSIGRVPDWIDLQTLLLADAAWGLVTILVLDALTGTRGVRRRSDADSRRRPGA